MEFEKIIHQTWKNYDLPDNFKEWAETWKKYNPDYEYKLWSDEDNYNFLNQKYNYFLKYYDSYNHHIKKVDATRYFYLYEYGGIYCDLDFECLKNFNDLLEKYKNYDVILGYMGNDKNFDHCIPNALMISKRKTDFWLHVINKMSMRVNNGTPEYDTGPILLKESYEDYPHKEKIKILEPKYFYSIDWNTSFGKSMRRKFANENIKDSKKEKKKKVYFKDSYAITYWTHSW